MERMMSTFNETITLTNTRDGDVMPDPVAERLIGRHGDKPRHRLK
jgi:hypothetical protein